MSLKVTPQQMQAVLAQPGPKRYSFFIKKVADFEEAWGLWDDGWAMLGTDENEEVFPLWPAMEYAAACATGGLGEFQAAHDSDSVRRSDLIDDVLPKLEKEGVLPGIFPTPQRKAVTPTVDETVARPAHRGEPPRQGCGQKRRI
jgi:hypothetical protein